MERPSSYVEFLQPVTEGVPGDSEKFGSAGLVTACHTEVLAMRSFAVPPSPDSKTDENLLAETLRTVENTCCALPGFSCYRFLFTNWTG
jgi:hypothetical protein